MNFETAPQIVESLGLTVTELFLLVLVAPIVIGLLVGLERELAIFAAFAGLVAVIVSGSA